MNIRPFQIGLIAFFAILAIGGLFFEPTILTGVTQQMQVAREETFGPVAPLFKFSSEQEVLAVNELEDECYATPAIADGRIYIRTRGVLYCFGMASR